MKGRQGQFEITVNGRVLASREGGLVAKLTNRPFPTEESVVSAVRAALEGETA